MNYRIYITRRIDRPATDLGGYNIAVGKTDEEPFALRQVGPVYNNLLTSVGVYEHMSDLLHDVANSMGHMSWALVHKERGTPADDGEMIWSDSYHLVPPQSVNLLPTSPKYSKEEEAVVGYTLLAKGNKNGVWVKQ